VKVLFDQGTPAPLRSALADHVVETANERGWSALQNGDLIAVAEATGFEVFVTTDRNLKYQQNLTGRRLAIVVLLTTSWPRIRQALPAVVEAVDVASPGTYREVSIPNAAWAPGQAGHRTGRRS
jgi:predicted nuclease of predicted toxin-antitoxin system